MTWKVHVKSEQHNFFFVVCQSGTCVRWDPLSRITIIKHESHYNHTHTHSQFRLRVMRVRGRRGKGLPLFVPMSLYSCLVQ
jgi:hypothetical protein